MGAPDEFSFGRILIEAGDFGRFQLLIYMATELMLVLLAWSMSLMEYTAAIPDYQCTVFLSNRTENVTMLNVCDVNKTSCDVITFRGNMKTVVSEWGLVCDKKWIAQTITTIQMTGLLVGGIVFGHMSDSFGRKPTFFFSIFMIGLFNAVAYFSRGWIMFSALIFFIGMGCSGFMSSIVSFEFIRNNVRLWLNLIPGWSTACILLTAFCWRVHDWRYIHMAIAAMSLAAIPLWFVFPESFRWLLSKGKYEDAQMTIAKVARINGKPVPDVDWCKHLEQINAQKSNRYSIIDLFRRKQLRKLTFLFGLIWLFSAFSYYGMAFGVQELSGNFYLNMFLISVIDLPGNFILAFMNPWFGRKWSSSCLYLIAGVLALLVGIGKTIRVHNVGTALNVLALLSKLCISAGWNMATIWTNESFPTVARYIGTGFVSGISRIGSLTAPQIITLSLDVPGLLYTASGVVCIVSSVLCGFLKETKNRDLNDIIEQEDSPGIIPDDERTHLQVQHDESYKTFKPTSV